MKISVALCTYNGEKFLAAQLESILTQTQTPDEIIICDDRSSDKTVDIIQEYIKRFPGIIQLHINDQNLKFVKNFEKAIGLCTGEIIFLSDQDDIWLPEKVKRMTDFLNGRPEALLVFTDGDLIDESDNRVDGTLWEKWGFDTELKKLWTDNDIAFRYLLKGKNKVTGATVAFRASLKKTIFPFELSERYWHDAWISLFAAKQNGLAFMDVPLIKYRIHESQMIGIGNGVMIKNASASKPKSTSYKIARKVWRMLKGN